jgi:NADPH:quinone reductase-like Zn-dependent oxidoreductase
MLMRHPSVGQVAVVGVPDDRLGEVGMRVRGPSPGTQPDESELISWARDQMVELQGAAATSEVVDALPLNASGQGRLKYELGATMGFTGGRGVDVVLDVIGGDYLKKNLAAVAEKGTIIQVGVMGGGATEIDLGVVLRRRVRLIGTVLRSRPIEEKIAITQRFAAEVLPLFDAGAARPVIDSRFELDDIAEAHRHMEANANVGKILIDIRA